MAFWIGILVSGAFAWLTIKLRFYQTWALVFNILISIYLAIYLQPIIGNISAFGDTPYSNALTMIVVAAASFLILHGISYTFLTGQFNVTFPTVVDSVGAGLLGFLAGFLVWSFLSLLFYITPASQNTFVKEIGFTDQFQQTSVSYISRFCNLINAVVSSQNKESSAEQAISKLLKDLGQKARKKTNEKTKPVEPVKPKEAKTHIRDQNELGPPPEIEDF
ncbi:MAG: CvpA family protein [Phycisphaerae bacterium]|nr:CvpA family protein [Phycisphaerae bacterium]MDD5381223.1 CvpA family protein [Phycisphaerae bacterium]